MRWRAALVDRRVTRAGTRSPQEITAMSTSTSASTSTSPGPSITVDDVLRDLEAGRSLPLRPPDRLAQLPALRRPTLGGRSFLRSYLAARTLGRLHPRLARSSLLRLWTTPWVHPAALRPIVDPPGDPTPWTLETADTRLQGYAAGDGPTVVLVHGWAGRAADWRHLAGDLVTSGYRVVAPDLPAHGATGGAHTDLFALAGALTEVLTRERPVAVVAHSLGFPTTMLAIEGAAEVPSAIVAVAPGRRLDRAVGAFATRARLAAPLADELRSGIEARFGREVWSELDVDRVLPSLRAHGLVVHDTDDDEVPIDDARAIAAGWPDAELLVTNGLGHRRIVRDASVRTAIGDWLHEVAPATPGEPDVVVPVA
jgi:pimeloyl-ACP methyl ester carboxylesterase